MTVYRKHGVSERPRHWEWLQFWIIEDRRVYVVEMTKKLIGWDFAEVNMFGAADWPMPESAIVADITGPAHDQSVPFEPIDDADFIRRLLDFARRADSAPDGHYVAGQELRP